MKKYFKTKTKLILIIVVGILLYMGISATISRNEMMGNNAYNGVLMALSFGICIVMVLYDYKRGYIASIILMTFSLIMMLRSVIVVKNQTTIPGLAYQILNMLMLSLLASQFRTREREAVTDFLTGLYNRRGLYKVIKRKTEGNDPFYVMYVDLGNFKFINDNFGHSYGDLAMKIVADRIEGVVKKGGIITRIGGDEFVILLDGKHNPEIVAQSLIESICEKTTLEIEDSKVDCYLNAYVGVSEFPKDSMNHEALIKYADIAMYQATKDRNKRVCFFDQDMAKSLSKQMQLEHLVKEGLTEGYFYLMYQPQFSIDKKTIRGFEALLRMKTPDGMLISPGEFIPVAENSDLILRVDDMVLEMALRQFFDILRINPKLTVSVNVSAKNIASLDFTDKVKNILAKTGFPTKNLEIEITEYCLVQSMEITIENIRKLRDIGVQVALDDFGTGYTSLSYLSKMPINLLKIDKSLIDNIDVSDKNRDFVKAVIFMGHLMGCEVISEGVEDQLQLDILNDQQCDFIQGFIWGRPVEYNVAKDLVMKELN